MIDWITGECWLDEFPGRLPLIPYTVDKYTKVDCIVPLHSHQYSNVQIGCIYHLKKPATLIPRVLITQIDFYLTKTILHCVTDEQYNCLTMIVDKLINKKQYILPNGYIQATDTNHCIVVLTHTTQYHLIVPSYMTLNAEAQKYIQSHADEPPLECSDQKPQELLGSFEVADALSNAIPDCTGCYALHNIDKNIWYVGQGKSLAKRLKQHFSGIGGNGDVYADFKYGDKFEILVYPLAQSSFKTLSAQEHYYIAYYGAYENGYNRMK